MTVQELIKALQQFEGHLEVGGIGHFGELLDIQRVYKVGGDEFIALEIESAGNEPE